MNKQIIKLYEQAQDEVVDSDCADYHERIQLKFAQLIVRECAELSVNSQYTNTKSEYYEGFNEALIYAGNKIKQHFGVEE